ncbi:MAG TPA: hypothetical protein VF702_05285 [Allosphingosinicella sp.]
MSESHPEHPSARRLRECPAYFRIEFEPVPVKARRDGWTPERQRGFIDRLVVSGSVAKSARAVGMTPQSAWALKDRKGAASFRRAWRRALESGRSYQIDVGLERSIMGERIPMFRGGRLIGEKLRVDNRLAMSVLNALDRRAERRPSSDAVAVLDRYLRWLERGPPDPDAEK